MNDNRKALLKFALSFALILAAYLPTLKWFYDRWTYSESYYGHGFLIPLASLFIIWQRRRILRSIKLSSDLTGLALVAVCMAVHLASSALRIYFISGFSMVFAIYGLVIFSFGKKIAGNLIFPIFFLLAMVPLPLVLISNLTVKLKLFVATASTFVLNHVGFPSVRDGSTIIMPNSHIVVAAPCSGLRSLIALLTLGVLFSYAIKMSYPKKIALFMSSIPIALTTNLIRITALAIVNDLYGEKVAMGFFHDFSGFAVFGLAFVMLYGVSRTFEGGGYEAE